MFRPIFSGFVVLAIFFISCSSFRYQLTPDAQKIHDNLSGYTQVQRIELQKNSEYETPAFFFSGKEPGTHILIIGGTHGNEPAGYEAALRLVDRFYKKPPANGKVIIIPEANKQADLTFERRIPVPDGIDIEKGNLNRCYPGDPDGLPMQRIAADIQKIAIDNEVTVFIDLHEAVKYHLEHDESTEWKALGQTIIYSPNEPSSWILMNILDEINKEITDTDKKFSGLERPILNSAAWWAGEYLGIAAFTFETSRKDPIEERVDYHLRLVDIVLNLEGVL